MEYSLIVLLGFVVGVIAPIAGITGLIIVPAMIFMGISPHLALGTSRLSYIFLWLAAFKKFESSGKIVKSHLWPLSIAAVTGGTIGAMLVLKVPEDMLKTLIGVFTLLVVSVAWINPKLGIEKTETSKHKHITGFISYFLLSIYGGFFGGGIGALTTVLCAYFFGWTMLESKATQAVPKILRMFVGVAPFVFTNQVDYIYGGLLGLGMLAGGYLGAHIAIEKGDIWLKRVFMATSAVMALKLIWEAL